jgi:hypothetical protein
MLIPAVAGVLLMLAGECFAYTSAEIEIAGVGNVNLGTWNRCNLSSDGETIDFICSGPAATYYPGDVSDPLTLSTVPVLRIIQATQKMPIVLHDCGVLPAVPFSPQWRFICQP